MDRKEEQAIKEQYRRLGYIGETHTRGWVKSIIWRVIGIFILGGIAYAFTHSWAQTTWITIIFHSIRTILYYFHERIWNRIDWGRIRVR